MPKRSAPQDPHAAREAEKYDRPIPSREFILETLEKASGPLNHAQLCDLLELDYAEAAQSLSISIGTVKSRIFRGREKLRQILTREQLYGLAAPGGES